MKSYPEYKETKVEWVGKLPSHWKVMPLKYAALVNREALTEQVEEDFELQYIDIGNVNQLGLVNPPERMKFVDAPSRARRIIKKNDTIISTVRTYLKAVAFIDRDDDNLIASTGFATLTSLNETHPKYLYYLVSNQGFVDTVSACSTGVSYPAITSTELARIIAWLPPLPEQQAIADFLDRKTAQIDTLIEKKQRQIDLLQEQRTALINHAVTKGLNPDVHMKDSGVEWLGEIPSHWNFAKVKYVCKVKGRIGFRGYTTDDQVSEGEGALTLGATHITSKGVIDLSAPVFISWEKYYESPEIMVNQKDILVVQRGSTCGKVGYIENEIGQATINPSLVILKELKINSKFLFYSLSSKLVEYQFSPTISKTAIPMLSQEQIGNFSILLPEATEQKKIVDYLDKEQLEFDKAIDIITRQIDTLQEYRMALISEAVTGKIDVR